MKVKIDVKKNSQLTRKNNRNNNNNGSNNNTSSNESGRRNSRVKGAAACNDSDDHSSAEGYRVESVGVEKAEESNHIVVKEEVIINDDLPEEVSDSEEEEVVEEEKGKGSFAGIYNPLESIKRTPSSLRIFPLSRHNMVINSRNNLNVSKLNVLHAFCFSHSSDKPSDIYR